MNGYGHNGGFQGESVDAKEQQGGGNGVMMMMGQDGMGGGQSLDEIVNQNAQVMRRQSFNRGLSFNNAPAVMGDDMRGMPDMVDYSNPTPANQMAGFKFDPNAAMSQAGMMSGGNTPATAQAQPQQSMDGKAPGANLGLNTSFANNSQGYGSMMQPNSAYASPAHPQNGFDFDMTSPYLDNSIGMQMDYNVDQNQQASNEEQPQMNVFNQLQYNPGMMHSPTHAIASQEQAVRMSQAPSQDPGSGPASGGRMPPRFASRSNSGSTIPRLSRSHSSVPPTMNSPAAGGGVTPTAAQSQQPPPSQEPPKQNVGFQGQPQNPAPGSNMDRGVANSYNSLSGSVPVDPAKYDPNNQGFAWETPEGGWPSTMVGRPHMQTSYKNTYSSTGFDMLGVLMRVATRPNPEINIGSVDLSCAFVVCDAEKDDFPIVYCSDNFERMTGYTKHMILGRNCRFLQSPDGNVAPGVKRKYVDDDSVLYLKNTINLRREAQISLINYRRGGQPFMNLLTMIPITWDTDQVKFFVGFQVDLVEQPNAVTNKNPDGSYAINYQRGMTMPRYVVNPPDASQKSDLGQTISTDDISAILSTYGSDDSEYAKRVWDKVLLENTDDVVHVLSLKGLFQWVSPSAARVLEYEPSEIIGTALSSVCHPSDIVPVTRELKDTSTGASVNVVFRIRRKKSGYLWFEGHGSLHTEQGKGRKSIILVGRERPVYTLSRREIEDLDGIGENELWTKMSTSGMFLFVASNVRQLLDRQPEELVGISIHSLMRTESKTEFARILEHARTGKKASVKHEMINRRGQVLSAFTTLYPGDATEGHKPTFIVAQTKLIKFSRGTPTSRPQLYPKQDRNSTESMLSIGASTANSVDQPGHLSTETGKYINTIGAAATYAGQNGLEIGRQDASLASEDNLFDELKTTKSSSWQYEIRQLEKRNRLLAEEVQSLIASKKKRKRRRGKDQQKDCANCHTRVTPEWRRGPSGQRDLCNSCGLRWAKVNGRVSPRTSSQASDKASKASASPRHQPQHQQPQQPASGFKNESPAGGVGTPIAPVAVNPPGGEVREGPKATGRAHAEGGHAASMEGAHGVPDRIEEGVEPN